MTETSTLRNPGPYPGAEAEKIYRFGFVDETGREVIPTVFDSAFAFAHGYATVKWRGKLFLIDKSGCPIFSSENSQK